MELIFEISKTGRAAAGIPESDVPVVNIENTIGSKYLRDELDLPEVAEIDLVRHYTNLSRRNFGVDLGFYPLGSCTMKYNPKINENVAALPGFTGLHPYADAKSAQGNLQLLYAMQKYLCAIFGMADFLRRARRKWGRVYCLKGDIRKYFPSIDHDVLKNIIRRRIACPDTLAMIDEIIDHSGDVGIPIGNLTSQLFANVYLDQLDHFVKDELREVYYLRYMDDFCLFDGEKQRLNGLYDEIDGYLKNVLHLAMNGKTQVFPVGPRAIDFLGYRIRPDVRLLRKQNVRRMRRRLKKLARQARAGIITWAAFRPHLASWMGHCRYADSYRIRNSVMRSAGILAEAV